MKKLFIALLLCVVFLSCSKQNNGPAADPYASPDFYVKFRDGSNNKDREYRQTINNIVVDANSARPSTNNYEESCVFYKKNSNTQEGFVISFSKTFYNTPSQYQLDSLFAYGRYTNFSTLTSSGTLATISYVDSSGIEWSTRNTTALDQAGSAVTIASVETSGGPGFRYKVKGTLSCRLYNTSTNTLFKQITNGAFTGKFGFGN